MEADRSLHTLRGRIFQRLRACILDFELIAEGDRLLVAVSGGKDSLSVLALLRELQGRAPVRFDLHAVHIDHGEQPEALAALEAHLQGQGCPYLIEHDPIPAIARAQARPGDRICFLCARMRRGVLYRLAPALGCNKIVLGHHRDDLIETVLLNLFYSGQLKSMPPLLRANDGHNVVIRPLAYVPEADLAAFCAKMGFPVMPCGPCCVEAGVDSRRRQIKELIAQLTAKDSHVPAHMLAALRNVRPSHLLDPKILPGLPG